jgi:hypothetical protein
MVFFYASISAVRLMAGYVSDIKYLLTQFSYIGQVKQNGGKDPNILYSALGTKERDISASGLHQTCVT